MVWDDETRAELLVLGQVYALACLSFSFAKQE